MTFYFKFTQESQPRPNVPAALAVPNTGFLGALRAQGSQIYRLGNDGIWRFSRPEAALYIDVPRADGRVDSVYVVSHFGTLATDGSGSYIPNWKQVYDTDDDSGVQATRLASVDAPDPRNLPWLSLKVTTHFGGGPQNAMKGVFGGTQYIQRIDTVGGVAPRDIPNGATPGVDWRVAYSATYCFWGADVHVRGGIL